MRDLPGDLLAGVLARTLEDAAFVFADATDDPPPFEGSLVEARLSCDGAVVADLRLVASPALAASIAANLLGEEEGGAEATGDDEDAVGELLNMVAGILAPELGDGAPCRLGVPRVRRVSPAEHAEALGAARAAATLVEQEGRRIDLSVELTEVAR